MADQNAIRFLDRRTLDAPVRRSILGSQLMTDASASERAYLHLKSAILGGKLRSEILDIRQLGDQLKMSVTPVRDALARLTAERLVRFVPHHGYVVIRLNARRLEELYELSGLLIDSCLRRVADTLQQTGMQPTGRPALSPLASAYADKVTALFFAIAAAQPNRELLAQVEILNARLFLARHREVQVFQDAEIEAANLVHLWENQEYAELIRESERHHTARLTAADLLARVLDTSPDAS